MAVPEKASPGLVRIYSYALYYLCEGLNRTYLYRQDVVVEVQIRNAR